MKVLHGKKHLNMSYWGLALMDIVSKKNIIPSLKKSHTTPYFEWYGKKFDMKGQPLIPFGSIVN